MANNKGHGLTTTHKIMIGGFAAVIIAVAAAAYVMRPKGEAGAAAADIVPKENFVVAEDSSDEEIEAQLAAMAENNMFFVSMNGVWTFKDGETPSHDAIMENSDQNKQDMFVTVVLEGTEDVVYQSEVISPGDALSDITLLRDLEPGEYDCIAVHHPLLADGTEETQVNMRMKVVVEE